MTIKIYRVENEAKSGMYQGTDLGFILNDTELHPLPFEDSSIAEWYKSIHDKNIHFFGFKSIEQLKMWIHKESVRKDIADKGFIVNVYEYNPSSGVSLQDPTLAILGDTQAIFWRECFNIISQYNLNYI